MAHWEVRQDNLGVEGLGYKTLGGQFVTRGGRRRVPQSSPLARPAQRIRDVVQEYKKPSAGVRPPGL